MGGSFDVVVVGAGHAGCEAAAAVARMGGRVAVVTLDRQRIAEMPCNPAMGGVGKGHLIVEIDALGGLQGWAADRAGLQFRMLNRSRGPAVWGPRAQCDKDRYTQIMRRILEGLAGVHVIDSEVVGLIGGDGSVRGVRLGGGGRVYGREVVLTTGTFLRGVLHVGGERWEGGRHGERPSVDLGKELLNLGLELRRFKTGTPPRLDRRSLDLGAVERQEGDRVPEPFSWRTRRVRNKVVCWVTRTPAEVRRIIEDNLDRSPLFSGQIEGVGPRYCPSIEDKVVRFPDHEEHTVFLEPEGERTDSIYVNGLSTSLPRDVQERVVRAVPGLQNAVFLRYGYAVEYDVVAPGQVDATLAVRGVKGLRVAGQVVGTSGYEEAAGLGFVAGVNAWLAVVGREPLILERERSYMGVLVDDLVKREHREPYRMLTSRAEHRLVMGVDSARERLMGIGRVLGLVPENVFHVEQERWRRRDEAGERLRETVLNPNSHTREVVARLAGVELRAPTTWAKVLRRREINGEAVASQLVETRHLSPEDRRIVIGRMRYEGYVARHEREIERVQRLRAVCLPEVSVLRSLPGLSREVIDALERYRPRTLAEAESLPGMTPAAMAILAARLAVASAGVWS